MDYGNFTKKAELYDTYRPRYSSKYKDYLINEIGISSSSWVADIGAGTGIHSRLIYEITQNLEIIEPDMDMLAICRKNIISEKCIFINSPAENIEFNHPRVDFITVAQAFHLFDSKKCMSEFKKLLKSEGITILVWNSKEHNNDVFSANEKVIKKYCPKYSREIHAHTFDEDTYRDLFENDMYSYVRLDHDSDEYLSKETFIGRTLSASYAITSENDLYNEFCSKLEDVFIKYSQNGKIYIPQSTVIYYGKII